MRWLSQQGSMRSIARPRMGGFVAAVLLVASLAGCLGDGGQGDPAEDPDGAGADGDQSGPAREPVTWRINIQSADFIRGSITIQAGDTVEWTKRGGSVHTVTADNGEFDSGPMGPGPIMATFAFKFDDIGKYAYHCEVHPAMEDTITVVERFDGEP